MNSNTDIVNAYTYQLGPGRHILYFGDPMCSWCWGFAPVIDQMIKVAHDKASFHVITTGLRPGVDQPWDEQLRGYIGHHWQNVLDATGQPFDFARLKDPSFIYNTEPACRAVVTVRTLKPDATFQMFKALQRAFYANGHDITNTEHLTKIAESLDINAVEFKQAFEHEDALSQTVMDFKLTRIFGVQGFPTVLLINDVGIQTLTPGYQSWDSLQPRLQEWLNA